MIILRILIVKDGKMKVFPNFYLFAAFTFLIICQVTAQNKAPKVNPEIWVRSGYQLSIAVVSDLRPRHMALGPDGTLYYTTISLYVPFMTKEQYALE